ncbi:MAG: hypothetical protein IT200_09670 [Thermoleophilia bacterium]|nr:hypothetical protein [Thermoleophilia bacterium]
MRYCTRCVLPDRRPDPVVEGALAEHPSGEEPVVVARMDATEDPDALEGEDAHG